MRDKEKYEYHLIKLLRESDLATMLNAESNASGVSVANLIVSKLHNLLTHAPSGVTFGEIETALEQIKQRKAGTP